MEVTVSAQEIGLTLKLSELRDGANELQCIWRAQAIPYQESANLSQDLLSSTRRIEGPVGHKEQKSAFTVSVAFPSKFGAQFESVPSFRNPTLNQTSITEARSATGRVEEKR